MKIAAFNVENLFFFTDKFPKEFFANKAYLETISQEQWDKYSVSKNRNKPLFKMYALAGAIRDLDADLYLLTEVGGPKSIKNFCQYFLDNEYHFELIEGNSDRGIDLCYLFKKDFKNSFKVDYKLKSHKNRPLDLTIPGKKKKALFSRDVLQLDLISNAGVIFLKIFLVHLKSYISDKELNDPNGRKRRKAELDKLVEIYNEESTDTCPVIIGGDFNGAAGRVETGQEFLSIYKKTKLEDILEILNLPHSERFTYSYFNKQNNVFRNQLDYLFIPKDLWAKVDHENSGIYHFKDEAGNVWPHPRRASEKFQQPSDHYPLYITLLDIVPK